MPAWLSLPANGSLADALAQPVLGGDRRRRHDLLTGYIAVSPLPEYAGLGDRRTALPDCHPGTERRDAARPVADAAQHRRYGRNCRGADDRAGNSHRIDALSTQGLSLSAPVSNLFPIRRAVEQERRTGGEQARAAYRAVNGALALSPRASTVHPLNETDGSLNLANWRFTASVKRALANDVTVCGEHDRWPMLRSTSWATELQRSSICPRIHSFPPHPNPPSSASYSTRHRSISACGATGRTGYLSLGAGGSGHGRAATDRRRDGAHLA